MGRLCGLRGVKGSELGASTRSPHTKFILPLPSSHSLLLWLINLAWSVATLISPGSGCGLQLCLPSWYPGFPLCQWQLAVTSPSSVRRSSLPASYGAINPFLAVSTPTCHKAVLYKQMTAAGRTWIRYQPLARQRGNRIEQRVR